MKIVLTPHEVDTNKTSIKACLNGNMCRIMRIEHTKTGETEHVIFPDVSAGWHFTTGRTFHGTQLDGDYLKTGLGTFYLINATYTNDGGYALEFTDDLNPDMP